MKGQQATSTDAKIEHASNCPACRNVGRCGPRTPRGIHLGRPTPTPGWPRACGSIDARTSSRASSRFSRERCCPCYCPGAKPQTMTTCTSTPPSVVEWATPVRATPGPPWASAVATAHAAQSSTQVRDADAKVGADSFRESMTVAGPTSCERPSRARAGGSCSCSASCATCARCPGSRTTAAAPAAHLGWTRKSSRGHPRAA